MKNQFVILVKDVIIVILLKKKDYLLINLLMNVILKIYFLKLEKKTMNLLVFYNCINRFFQGGKL